MRGLGVIVVAAIAFAMVLFITDFSQTRLRHAQEQIDQMPPMDGEC